MGFTREVNLLTGFLLLSVSVFSFSSLSSICLNFFLGIEVCIGLSKGKMIRFCKISF